MPHQPRSLTPTSTRGGEDLDPDIRRFVREMSAGWAAHPTLSSVSPAEARAIADAVRKPWTTGGPQMASVTDLVVTTTHGCVTVRCFRPFGTLPAGALVYLHGGGWTIFSIDTHDRLMREYAARTGLLVLGVAYSLSPEVRYPVALDEVCEVVTWVAAEGQTLGIDPRRIAVGGDSAGANLAVAAALRLRDAGQGDIVRALLLNYGVFDRESSQEAQGRFGGAGYMLGADEMEQFWRNYLRDERDAADPLVSPLRAELEGLPNALLVIPECDLLTEQSLAMAARLRTAGVDVVSKLYPGATHSFLEAVSIAPVADRAIAETADWLLTILGENTR